MNARNPGKSALVYVDANVFLNYILYDPKLVPQAVVAKQFLEQVLDRRVKACTSLLTWDEVVWVVRRELSIEDARMQGMEFLDFPNLTFLTVTRDTVKRAQGIIEQSALKPRDAIHIASAVQHGATQFVTFDDQIVSNQFIPCRKLV